jgi:hypothetical protein
MLRTIARAMRRSVTMSAGQLPHNLLGILKNGDKRRQASRSTSCWSSPSNSTRPRKHSSRFLVRRSSSECLGHPCNGCSTPLSPTACPFVGSSTGDSGFALERWWKTLKPLNMAPVTFQALSTCTTYHERLALSTQRSLCARHFREVFKQVVVAHASTGPWRADADDVRRWLRGTRDGRAASSLIFGET